MQAVGNSYKRLMHSGTTSLRIVGWEGGTQPSTIGTTHNLNSKETTFRFWATKKRDIIHTRKTCIPSNFHNISNIRILIWNLKYRTSELRELCKSTWHLGTHSNGTTIRDHLCCQNNCKLRSRKVLLKQGFLEKSPKHLRVTRDRLRKQDRNYEL